MVKDGVYMKKWLSVALCVLLLVSLCACSKKKDNDFSDSFKEYHSGSVDGDYIISSQNGVSFMFLSLEKEKDSSSPYVVLDLQMLGNDKLEYDWLKLSPDVRKSELRSYGDMVIEYAKANNWNNRYYLYVTLSYGYSSHIVYDYEQDTIWIPKNEFVLLSMYEQFGTMSYSKLEETEDGKNFLVRNGLAEMVHGEIEYTYSADGYNVYISSEGEFKDYGKSKSTAY